MSLPASAALVFKATVHRNKLAVLLLALLVMVEREAVRYYRTVALKTRAAKPGRVSQPFLAAVVQTPKAHLQTFQGTPLCHSTPIENCWSRTTDREGQLPINNWKAQPQPSFNYLFAVGRWCGVFSRAAQVSLISSLHNGQEVFV